MGWTGLPTANAAAAAFFSRYWAMARVATPSLASLPPLEERPDQGVGLSADGSAQIQDHPDGRGVAGMVAEQRSRAVRVCVPTARSDPRLAHVGTGPWPTQTQIRASREPGSLGSLRPARGIGGRTPAWSGAIVFAISSRSARVFPWAFAATNASCRALTAACQSARIAWNCSEGVWGQPFRRRAPASGPRPGPGGLATLLPGRAARYGGEAGQGDQGRPEGQGLHPGHHRHAPQGGFPEGRAPAGTSPAGSARREPRRRARPSR